MASRMARPWQDPKSHIWHLRQPTPADLLAKIKGATVTLPVGGGCATVKVGPMVQASLKTTDRTKARELHVKADVALQRFWDRHRSGPARLIVEEAAAPAGTLYADFARLEDDPGSPELWIKAEEGNMAARSGEASLIVGAPAMAASVARRERFGGFADVVLAREGLVADEARRELLRQAVQGAVEDATARLREAADFDFTPDPAPRRFPEWQRPAAAKAPTGRLSVDDLFAA